MSRARRLREPEALQQRSLAPEPEARSIDEIYGLEPVFEPGGAEGGAMLGEFVEFPCPWCGETIGTAIDLTGGSRRDIEDCQVCCRPMEILIEVGEGGELIGVSALCSD